MRRKEAPPTLITYELVYFDPNSDFLAALPIPTPEPKFVRPVKQPRVSKSRSKRPVAATPQPRALKWTFPPPAPRAKPEPRPLSNVIPPAPPAYVPRAERTPIQQPRSLPKPVPTSFLRDHLESMDALFERINRVIDHKPHKDQDNGRKE